MTQKITDKKDFVGARDMCLNGQYLIEGSAKKKTFERFCEITDALLITVADNENISDAGCFDFAPYDSFADFVRNESDETVKEKLKEIECKLSAYVQTCTYNRTRVNTAKEKSTSKYFRIKNIVFWASIVAIIVTVIIVFICALVQGNTNDAGDNAPNNYVDFAALAGILDFGIGGAGFVIERVLDHISRKKEASANDAIAEHAIDTEHCNGVVNNVIKSVINCGGDIRIGDDYYIDGVNIEEQRNNMANSASNNVIKTFYSKGNIQIGNTYRYNQKKNDVFEIFEKMARDRLDQTNEISGSNSTASNNSTEEEVKLSFEDELKKIREENWADF